MTASTKYKFTFISAKISASGSVDAYICLHVAGKGIGCTDYTNGDSNPVWYESMTATVGPTDEFVVSLYDDDFGPDYKYGATLYKPAQSWLKAGGHSGPTWVGSPHTWNWVVVPM